MNKRGRRSLVTIRLKFSDRKVLKALISKGSAKAREINRAHILLMSDAGKSPKDISEFLTVQKKTIQNIKERYLKGGLKEALYEKARPGKPPKLSGKIKAKITALACTDPPEGQGRWSLRLLAEKIIELKYVKSISHTYVGKVLKKTN